VSNEASFVARLVDRVTGPARKIGASMRALNRAMDRSKLFGRGAERDAGGRFLARSGIMKGLDGLTDKIGDWSKTSASAPQARRSARSRPAWS
jgi:hypothetical protein